MKKQLILAAAMFAFVGSISADIVVQGARIKTTTTGGNTYVTCRGSGECLRIKTRVDDTYDAYLLTPTGEVENVINCNMYTVDPADDPITGEQGWDVSLINE